MIKPSNWILEEHSQASHCINHFADVTALELKSFSRVIIGPSARRYGSNTQDRVDTFRMLSMANVVARSLCF